MIKKRSILQSEMHWVVLCHRNLITVCEHHLRDEILEVSYLNDVKDLRMLRAFFRASLYNDNSFTRPIPIHSQQIDHAFKDPTWLSSKKNWSERRPQVYQESNSQCTLTIILGKESFSIQIRCRGEIFRQKLTLREMLYMLRSWQKMKIRHSYARKLNVRNRTCFLRSRIVFNRRTRKDATWFTRNASILMKLTRRISERGASSRMLWGRTRLT